jgi:hypothetical protein
MKKHDKPARATWTADKYLRHATLMTASGLWDLCESPCLNVWMPHPTFMKHHDFWAHLNGVLHKSLQSVYVLYVYPSRRCEATARLSVSLLYALGKHAAAASNTRCNGWTVLYWILLLSMRSAPYQSRVCGSSACLPVAANVSCPIKGQ